MEQRGQDILKWLRKNSGTLLAAVVALLTAAVLLLGGVSAKLNDDALTVRASFTRGERVAYDDIRAARLLEDFDFGQRLGGVRTLRLQAGRYLNDAFGAYKLYAYSGVPVCIDIRTDEGHLVFNAPTERATRALYDELVERLPDVP